VVKQLGRINVMRQLSERQEGILQGSLQGLGLPVTARLYVSEGLQEVFRWVVSQPQEHMEESWLYIPWEQVRSIRQSLVVEGSDPLFNHVAKHCYTVNGYNLYPVLVRGHIRAVVVETSGKTCDISASADTALIESLSAFEDSAEKSDGATASCFISTLFQRDNGFELFTKKLLDLLTEQQPDSLAALYSESDGIYRQRFIVGNLHLYDKLAGELNLATAREWIESMRKERFFLPVDLLPDHPTFLDSPPNFLFVHPGIHSERTEYIIAVVFGGHITLQVASWIREIARLSSMLHDSQFSTSSEFLSLFSRLDNMIDLPATVDDIILEVFRLLDQQMILSCLTIVLPSGSSRTVVRGPRSELQVRHNDSPVVAKVQQVLSEDSPRFLQTLQDQGFSKEEAKWYFLENIKSEACFPIRFGAGARGLVAVGSPVEGEYLLSVQPLLSYASKFISLWSGFAHSKETTLQAIDQPGAGENVLILKERFRTIRKLTEGYFHDIRGWLSVALGQSEILRNALSSAELGARSEGITAGMHRITQAVDNIAEQVERLRDICSVSEERLPLDVSVQKFLAGLPSMIHGYARQINDSSNTSVTVQAKTDIGHDFSWPLSVLFDSVLPLVLVLMEKATRSGVLQVTARSGKVDEAILLEFNRDIIGDATLNELIHLAFQDIAFVVEDGKRSRVSLNGLHLTYGVTSRESFLIRLSRTKANDAGDRNRVVRTSGVRRN